MAAGKLCSKLCRTRDNVKMFLMKGFSLCRIEDVMAVSLGIAMAII